MPKSKAAFDKYAWYEKSVQSPKRHVDWFVTVYHELRGRYASRMREDFCGTFAMSCEWVKRNRKNTAVGLDLDPEPLAYGKRVHLAGLDREQKKRVQVFEQDVLHPPVTRPEFIVACNFSFYIFKQRSLLLKYFRSCLKSLSKDGVLLLEMAGGPGFISPMKEQKTIREKNGSKFTYVWEQKSFDPITHDALYAIHFKFPDGRTVKNAFVYDWRLWTIPEVRDALREAGFKQIHVYWETTFRGEGTGEFVRMESGDNAHAWIAYVVALK